jgi:uncharacterized protein (TIGR03435 family)
MKCIAAAVLLVSATLFVSQPFAQDSPIKFDVISFRKCAQIDLVHKGTIIPTEGDSIEFHCQPMLGMFEFAYGAGKAPHAVKSESGWADGDAWDFQAKVGAADVPAWHAMNMAGKRQMVRTVLEEKLNAKVHFTSELRPTYDLVVAKGGPKVTPSTPDPNAPDRGAATGIVNWVAPLEAAYVGATMRFFANGLSARLDRNVIDKTGLTGSYTFHVKGLPYAHYDPRTASVDNTDFGAIVNGVEELGLELVPDKAETDVVVIDHIERPSEN